MVCFLWPLPLVFAGSFDFFMALQLPLVFPLALGVDVLTAFLLVWLFVLAWGVA